jgi:putative membrane protein
VDEKKIIQSAQFNKALISYMYLIVLFWCAVTFIGIVFIPIWILIGWFFTRRYYNSLECTLTTKTIEIKKGVLFRVEKTIPLDKIQDLTLREGPLLRALKLCMVEIETAGQSNPQGSDAKIIGIDDAKGFRNMVLKQRDLLLDVSMSKSSSQNDAAETQSQHVLFEIRDALLKIEEHLREK